MQSLGIRLYLPDDVLARRIDVGLLAVYIQALEKQLITTCGPLDLWEADGLLIAVGIKPGGVSRIWCESVIGNLPAADLGKITADLAAVIPPTVRGGAVAFAFNIQLLESENLRFPNAPKEWLASGPEVIPDQLFARIWPTTEAPAPPFSWRFPTRIHNVQAAGRTLQLVAPLDPDMLLTQSQRAEKYQADGTVPYWPIVWPSGIMMAERILRAGAPLPQAADTLRALELGCGLGLAGIAAGLRGYPITFTDLDAEALAFTQHNALRNGLAESAFRTSPLDWSAPGREKYSWIIASDVLYEPRLQPLLLAAVEQLLAPGGQAWVLDPDRIKPEEFTAAAIAGGLAVATESLEGEGFDGKRQKGVLFILTRVP